MSITLNNLGQVFIACRKTDMRQGIDSLAFSIKENFQLDHFSGEVFLFCGGKKIALKHFIGMEKDSGYSINVLKMEN